MNAICQSDLHGLNLFHHTLYYSVFSTLLKITFASPSPINNSYSYMHGHMNLNPLIFTSFGIPIVFRHTHLYIIRIVNHPDLLSNHHIQIYNTRILITYISLTHHTHYYPLFTHSFTFIPTSHSLIHNFSCPIHRRLSLAL